MKELELANALKKYRNEKKSMYDRVMRKTPTFEREYYFDPNQGVSLKEHLAEIS